MAGTGSAVVDQQAAAHKGIQGSPAVVDPTITDPIKGIVKNPNPHLRYTFNDGTYFIVQMQTPGDISTAQITDGGTAVKPAPGIGTPAKPTQIGTNTKDQFIVQQNPDGSQTTITNPNYVPPKVVDPKAPITRNNNGVSQQWDPATQTWINPPGAPAATTKPTTVATNTTDQFIIQMAADGTTKQIPNPNYVPPKATQVGTNPNDPFIQMSDGTVTPNQNYTGPQTINGVPLATFSAAINAKIKQQNSDIAQGRLDTEQAKVEFSQWFQTNVKAPIDQQRADAATQNAATASQRADWQQQYQTDTMAQTAKQNAFSNANTMEQTGQQAGRDAVAAAQAGTVNRVGPGFGQDFSNSLNALSSGQGNVSFGAGDFTYKMPDYGQLSRDAAVQAIARLQAMNTPYAGPQAAPVAATPTTVPPVGTPPGFVPPAFSAAASTIPPYQGPVGTSTGAATR
jgi:hypothetical protein